MPVDFPLSGFFDSSLFSAAVQSCEKIDLSFFGLIAVIVLWDVDWTVFLFQHVWKKSFFYKFRTNIFIFNYNPKRKSFNIWTSRVCFSSTQFEKLSGKQTIHPQEPCQLVGIAQSRLKPNGKENFVTDFHTFFQLKFIWGSEWFTMKTFSLCERKFGRIMKRKKVSLSNLYVRDFCVFIISFLREIPLNVWYHP